MLLAVAKSGHSWTTVLCFDFEMPIDFLFDPQPMGDKSTWNGGGADGGVLCIHAAESADTAISNIGSSELKPSNRDVLTNEDDEAVDVLGPAQVVGATSIVDLVELTEEALELFCESLLHLPADDLTTRSCQYSLISATLISDVSMYPFIVGPIPIARNGLKTPNDV